MIDITRQAITHYISIQHSVILLVSKDIFLCPSGFCTILSIICYLIAELMYLDFKPAIHSSLWALSLLLRIMYYIFLQLMSRPFLVVFTFLSKVSAYFFASLPPTPCIPFIKSCYDTICRCAILVDFAVLSEFTLYTLN